MEEQLSLGWRLTKVEAEFSFTRTSSTWFIIDRANKWARESKEEEKLREKRGQIIIRQSIIHQRFLRDDDEKEMFLFSDQYFSATSEIEPFSSK